jgi:hypothetical protein
MDSSGRGSDGGASKSPAWWLAFFEGLERGGFFADEPAFPSALAAYRAEVEATDPETPIWDRLALPSWDRLAELYMTRRLLGTPYEDDRNGETLDMRFSRFCNIDHLG